MNFFFAALISSLIFSIAHGELEHLILYGAMGFTFAFLYIKTKRILVPIFTHVAMNTIVVIMQLNQKRYIVVDTDKFDTIIGGLTLKQTPLFSGIIYIVLGIVFTLFAIQNVNADGGWGFSQSY